MEHSLKGVVDTGNRLNLKEVVATAQVAVYD